MTWCIDAECGPSPALCGKDTNFLSLCLFAHNPAALQVLSPSWSSIFKLCVIASSLLCGKYLDMNMLNFFPLGALPFTGLPVMPSLLRSGQKTVGMKLFFRLFKDLRTVHPGRQNDSAVQNVGQTFDPSTRTYMKCQHLCDTGTVSQSLCPYNNHGQIGR